jgi:outer membrane cobalamin receptor
MLMSGVRLDSGSVTDVVVTPRAGAVFSLGDFSAKLLYGQAFRAPRPWDLSDGLGNPDLAPERMRSFEMSLGYRLLDNLRLEGVCYWNRLSNLFAREEIGTAAERVEWRWVNAGVTNTLGLELSAEMQWGALRSFVNYTHTRSVDAEDAAVAEVAAHGANLGVAYHVNRRIRASVWANVLGARPNPKLIAATDSRLIDSAVVLNASLSFLSMNGFDFQVMARNLLDEVYHHPSNRLPDRYRQPQCTVMVLAAYRF